jgi:flagellar hook-length control protein FliK
VRLDVDRNGQVTSRLTVDRVETLEYLRRDSADLERALQQAGLKTGDNGMQFTLRDQSFAGRNNNEEPPTRARAIIPDPELAPIDTLQNSYRRISRGGSGIDIRV